MTWTCYGRCLVLVGLLLALLALNLPPAIAQVGGVQKIDDTALSNAIADGDRFGFSTVSPGDIDNDGIPDLVVGAPRTNDRDGAIYVLLLDDQGGVKNQYPFFGSAGSGERFGEGVAHLGDLNRDGYPDIAVGTPNLDGSSESLRGGVWILFLDYDGSTGTVTVQNRQFIGESAGGFGDLIERSQFGADVTGVGDIDGDGVNDLAVGGTDGRGTPGAMWILLLNDDGTVKSSQKTPGADLGSTAGDGYGTSIAGVGDLDGDGVPDVAAGAAFDPDGGGERGIVRLLYLNEDGSVRDATIIRNPESLVGDGSSADGDSFGQSVTGLQDVNSDGISDLGVGAYRDDDGARDAGAFWILYLNDDGTVQAAQKVSATTGGFTGSLEGGDHFGAAVAAIDDVNRDGRPDVAVGAPLDSGSGTISGAAYVLFGGTDLLPQGTPGLPYVEGFETNGLGARYFAPGRFDGGANNYFRRVVGDFTYSGSIPGAIDGPPYEGYVNFEGDRLWAGENVDGVNSDGRDEKTLTLQTVDVSGARAVRFTGRFGANYNENLGSTFDSVDDPSQDITADSLVVRYKVDGQPNFQPGLKFSAVPDDSDFLLNFNNPLAEDTNFNGIGDGAILTPTMQDFGFDIPLPEGAQTVTIQIGVYTAESAEETGFDDLRLEAITGAFVSVANPLRDTDVAAGRSVTLDLAPVFQDSEGSALTYTATSGDAAVATVSTSDALEQLTVNGVGEGTTTIEVTAANGSGSSATDAFTLAVLPGPPNIDVDVRLARAADVCDPGVAGDCDSVVLPGLVDGEPRSDSVTVDPGTPVLVSTVIINNDSRDVTAVQLSDEKPGYTEAFTMTIPAGTSETFNRVVDAPLTPQILTSRLQATITTADGEQTARRDVYGLNVPTPEALMDVRIARPADVSGCDPSDLSTCTVPDPDPQDPLIPRDTVDVGVENEVVVTYAVTNVGQSTLARYTVTDEQGTDPITTGTSLAPGATATVTRLYTAPTTLGVNTFRTQVDVADAGGNASVDYDVYGFDVAPPVVELDVRIARAADVSGCDPSDLSTCTVPDPDPQDPVVPSDTLAVNPSEGDLLVTYDVTNTGPSTIQSLDVTDGIYGDVLTGESVAIAPGETYVTTRLRTAPSTPGISPNLSAPRAVGRDAGGNASRPDIDVWAFDVGAPALEVDVRLARPVDLSGCDPADPSTCTVPDPDPQVESIPSDTLTVDPQAEFVVTYDVTNTGQSPLTSLTVSDPNSSGDFSVSLSADLDPGASITTTRVYSAPTTVGISTVRAIVTGTDTGGNETGNGDVYGIDIPTPEVRLDVRIARPADVSGCDPSDLSTCTVPDPDPQNPSLPSDTVKVGGQGDVLVSYAVTNAGSSPLASYTVTDDRDARPVTSGTALAPGATETITLLRTAPAARGISTSVVRVEGTDAGGNAGQDAEAYGIEVVRPRIFLNVVVGKASEFCSSGDVEDAGCAVDSLLSDGMTPRPDTIRALPAGDEYLAQYYVTNIGSSTVASVQITDDGVGVASATGLTLRPGEQVALKVLQTASSSPGLVTYLSEATATDPSGIASGNSGASREAYGVQTEGIAFQLFTQVAPAAIFCTDPTDPSTCSTERLKRMIADPASAKAVLAKSSSDREVVRYRFFNSGSVPFVRHTLADNVAGTVFADRAETVEALDSLVVFEIYDEVPLIGESRSATWTAQAETGEVLAQMSAEQPLPVELTSFGADVADRRVTLQWTTASEENNAGFEVQRFDDDTGDWAALDFVPGAGTSTEARRYRYAVDGLEPNVYRFRLRQIDADGRFAVSEAVEAVVNIDGAYRLTSPAPHPVQTEAQFRLTTQEAQPVRIELYDLLGRRVTTVFDGKMEAGRTQDLPLRVDGMASGVYFLRVVGETFVTTQRVSVVR